MPSVIEQVVVAARRSWAGVFRPHREAVVRAADREQQARLFSLSGDLSCTLNEAGYFTQVNDALVGCLGYSREELLSQPWRNFLHPAERHSGESASNGGGGAQVIESTHRYRCKQGGYRWLQWRATAFEQGHAFAVGHDTTENARREQARRLSDARERELLDELQDHAFVVLDAHGRIVTTNTGAQLLTPSAQLRIVGHHFSISYDDHHPRAPGVEPPDCTEATEPSAQADPQEGRRRREEGTRFWANLLISAARGLEHSIQGVGAPIGAADAPPLAEPGLPIDREQLTLDLARSELVVGEMHHRVKNNLQLIVSMMNLQARAMAEGASRDGLLECQRRVHMLGVIHDRLRQTGGYMWVAFARYADNLARDVFRAGGGALRGVSLELCSELDGLQLHADQAVPCGLIINELITNALKHGFPNSKVGRVGLRLQRTVEGRVLLQVWDDGVGVSPVVLEPSRARLGMKLVIALVKQLRGELTVGENGGTSIQITFIPRERPVVPPAAEPSAASN